MHLLLSLSPEDTSDMVHDFTDDSSSVEVLWVVVVVDEEGWLEFVTPSMLLLILSPTTFEEVVAGLCNLLRSNEHSGHSCSTTLHGEEMESRQHSSICGWRTHLPSSLMDPPFTTAESKCFLLLRLEQLFPRDDGVDSSENRLLALELPKLLSCDFEVVVVVGRPYCFRPRLRLLSRFDRPCDGDFVRH